jgi:prepilin-type N-terminal cleavage/methylation domain-containing protein
LLQPVPHYSWDNWKDPVRMKTSNRQGIAPGSGRGFTLIELLVVVAVIAILIAVLLPALSAVRGQAQALQALSNARQVATALQAYTSDGGFGFNDHPSGRLSSGSGTYPPSYLYGAEETGLRYRWEDQTFTNPNPSHGYIHWSRLLFEGERVPSEAFQSPAVTEGGAPRSNPGPDIGDWTANQENDLGQTAPGGRYPEDRQAERVAFTGNAAIFSRNKFAAPNGVDPYTNPNQSQNFNTLVKTTDIDQPSNTILMTEFADKEQWATLMDGLVVKSHRPVDPFVGLSSGIEVLNQTIAGRPSFSYPSLDSIEDWGAIDKGAFTDGTNSRLNGVGRHHPGETTVFVYADGSGNRGDLEDSVAERRWGRKFYSLWDKGNPTGVSVDLEINAP